MVARERVPAPEITFRGPIGVMLLKKSYNKINSVNKFKYTSFLYMY